jgi:hypothetical protein
MPALAPPAPAETAPPRWLLAGLGAGARRFVEAVYADCEVGETEAHVLRVAAEAYDDAARARRARDGKAAQAATRQFLAALQRPGLPAPPERETR